MKRNLRGCDKTLISEQRYRFSGRFLYKTPLYKWVLTQPLNYLTLLLLFCFSSIMIAEENVALAPEDIIRKAIEARGGKEALSDFLIHKGSAKGFTFRGGRKMPIKADFLVRSNPPSSRISIEISLSETVIYTDMLAFDGKRALRKRNGVTNEGNDEEIKEVRVSSHYADVQLLLPALNNPRLTLHALPDAKINGKCTACVRVSSRDYPDVHLFFDKSTWLLVKSETSFKDRNREDFFEGYKRLKNGVLFATRKIVVEDGKKKDVLDLVDIEPLTEVKDSEFSKP